MIFKDSNAKQSHLKATSSYFNSTSLSTNLKQKPVEQKRGEGYRARRYKSGKANNPLVLPLNTPLTTPPPSTSQLPLAPAQAQVS